MTALRQIIMAEMCFGPARTFPERLEARLAAFIDAHAVLQSSESDMRQAEALRALAANLTKGNEPVIYLPKVSA